MKQTNPFVISEFTNPSGKIVFQLYARLDGKRFRKNFQTRTEAEAERQVQEVSWLQRDTGTRAAVTRLNEDQLHEAEAAFRRLASLPRSLSFYLDFALANYREPEKQKPLADAVAEYVTAKEHEFAQDQLSPPQMNRIRVCLKVTTWAAQHPLRYRWNLSGQNGCVCLRLERGAGIPAFRGAR